MGRCGWCEWRTDGAQRMLTAVAGISLCGKQVRWFVCREARPFGAHPYASSSGSAAPQIRRLWVQTQWLDPGPNTVLKTVETGDCAQYTQKLPRSMFRQSQNAHLVPPPPGR